MQTRKTLVIAGTGALLLAVVLAVAGAPVWGWAGVAVLALVTFAGAAASAGRPARRNPDPAHEAQR